MPIFSLVAHGLWASAEVHKALFTCLDVKLDAAGGQPIIDDATQ